MRGGRSLGASVPSHGRYRMSTRSIEQGDKCREIDGGELDRNRTFTDLISRGTVRF